MLLDRRLGRLDFLLERLAQTPFAVPLRLGPQELGFFRIDLLLRELEVVLLFFVLLLERLDLGLRTDVDRKTAEADAGPKRNDAAAADARGAGSEAKRRPATTTERANRRDPARRRALNFLMSRSKVFASALIFFSRASVSCSSFSFFCSSFAECVWTTLGLKPTFLAMFLCSSMTDFARRRPAGADRARRDEDRFGSSLQRRNAGAVLLKNRATPRPIDTISARTAGLSRRPPYFSGASTPWPGL